MGSASHRAYRDYDGPLLVCVAWVRYFSMGFSHDSIAVLQNDVAWQIALGRFLQQVYLLLRGKLCSPLLIGLISPTWLSLAIWILVELLDIHARVSILLIAGY